MGMTFTPMPPEEQMKLRRALERNVNNGAALLMDSRDTSFIGEIEERDADEEVVNAIRSIPTHYALATETDLRSVLLLPGLESRDLPAIAARTSRTVAYLSGWHRGYTSTFDLLGRELGEHITSGVISDYGAGKQDGLRAREEDLAARDQVVSETPTDDMIPAVNFPP